VAQKTVLLVASFKKVPTISQGSVVTHLMSSVAFDHDYYKFMTESYDERFCEIRQHLAKFLIHLHSGK